jgi:hypothetical protein
MQDLYLKRLRLSPCPQEFCFGTPTRRTMAHALVTCSRTYSRGGAGRNVSSVVLYSRFLREHNAVAEESHLSGITLHRNHSGRRRWSTLTTAVPWNRCVASARKLIPCGAGSGLDKQTGGTISENKKLRGGFSREPLSNRRMQVQWPWGRTLSGVSPAQNNKGSFHPQNRTSNHRDIGTPVRWCPGCPARWSRDNLQCPGTCPACHAGQNLSPTVAI